MLVRLACCLALGAAVVLPVAAHADCAQTISQAMSRDTEKLTTRYQRVIKRIEKSKSANQVAEACRIARSLEPMLSEQIAALKQSGCSKDPSVGAMLEDIVRGHEDDLAVIRKQVKAECR
jgi:hypothetical protein